MAGSVSVPHRSIRRTRDRRRTGFLEINVEETTRKRDDAERQVPLTFYHDPQSLSSLPEQLRADLGKITAAETLEALDESTQISFGIGGRLPAHLRESATSWTRERMRSVRNDSRLCVAT